MLMIYIAKFFVVSTTLFQKTTPACANKNELTLLLRSTLCVDACLHDCKEYVTPLGECYNGQILFPNDPSWGDVNIRDNPVVTNGQQQLHRRFFPSGNNTSCEQTETTDQFTLDLDVCLGPFGPPRPWGILTVESLE
jgi:hypothetical protein